LTTFIIDGRIPAAQAHDKGSIMSIANQDAIPEELRLQMTGFITEERPFLRRELMHEIVKSIPMHPELQVLIYQGEVASGVEIPWHIHNGPLLTIVIQGESILQFGEDVYHYKAGDCFIEPPGVLHRAYNPNPNVPTAALAIQITPPGRDHIVNTGDVPSGQMPKTAPRGPAQPKPPLSSKLAGSE
jgi:quercetin dioxygenase-like cupin family protein